MSAEAAILLFPKFTSLVSTDSDTTSFTSTPLDVSRFASAQFQVWRGPIIGSTVSFKVFLEESLDGENWVKPPGGGSAGFDPDGLRNLSYAFRLRWFRLRVDFKGKFVTCWAEGILR